MKSQSYKSIVAGGQFTATIHRFGRAARVFCAFAACALAFATVQADELELLWQLAPDDQPFVTADHTQRGLAFNPATGNLLLVSRAGGANVYVLDALTGTELRTLNLEGVAGGIFSLNMIGVAEDGVVYAGNLTTGPAAANYKLYRWENDGADTIPTIAFDGDPAGTNPDTGASNNAQRWGDTIDVRGSGANTMVVIASRASAAVAILTTTDGVNFTSTLIPNAAAGAGSLGVAFGAGNTIWTKSINQALRHVEFDLAAGKATLIKDFPNPVFPNTVTAIGVNAAKNWLGGVAVDTPDHFRLYDITNPADPVLADQADFSTDNANSNGVGSVDFGAIGSTNLVFALDTNNGIMAHRIVSTPATPPTINTQPANLTVLEGGAATLTIGVSGTAPLGYQWQLNQQDIAGATNASLTLQNVQLSAAGNYRVIASNVAGTVTSDEATLTVKPLVRSNTLTALWQIAPGERTYVATDNSQRGIAYNPVSGNLLLVSRSGGENRIFVLDGKTGAELRQLTVDKSVVFGGTFVINMIGVADDGAVYAANLVTDSAATSYAIYRWESDSADAAPQVAFLGDPSNGDATSTNRRFGDTFDVRGAGANTQILAGSRAGNVAAVFTTTDGATFDPTLITTDANPGDFGLGIAFGAGNTFWGTAAARPLRHISFDLAAGTGTVLHTYAADAFPASVAGIGVDAQNNLLAGISIETPDNLQLYNISDLANPPVLVDQELFPTDNVNGNGTGSVDFGGGNLYALDTNNGIVAFKVDPNAPPQAGGATLSAPAFAQDGSFTFRLTGTAGAQYNVQRSEDLVTWTTLSTETAGPDGTVQVVDRSENRPAHRFYRAVPAQ